MIYISASNCSDGLEKVIYDAKDDKSSKTSDALEGNIEIIQFPLIPYF